MNIIYTQGEKRKDGGVGEEQGETQIGRSIQNAYRQNKEAFCPTKQSATLARGY